MEADEYTIPELARALRRPAAQLKAELRAAIRQLWRMQVARPPGARYCAYCTQSITRPPTVHGTPTRYCSRRCQLRAKAARQWTRRRARKEVMSWAFDRSSRLRS